MKCDGITAHVAHTRCPSEAELLDLATAVVQLAHEVRDDDRDATKYEAGDEYVEPHAASRECVSRFLHRSLVDLLLLQNRIFDVLQHRNGSARPVKR